MRHARWGLDCLILGVTAILVVGSATAGSTRRQQASTRATQITRGGVQVGMTSQQVLARVGRPERQGASGGYTVWRYFEYTAGIATQESYIQFQGDRVVAFDRRPIPGAEAKLNRVRRVLSPGVSVQLGGGRVGRGAYAPALSGNSRQPACQNSLDCHGSGFCKDRGDGLRVCMNQGGHGDFCRSGNDCAGSEFCKQRSDGFKVCMGSNGGRGMVCHDGNDCGFGLFCKARGDGWRVCM